MRKPMFDIRTPADPEDFETTQSQSAIPPAEFQVTTGATSNIFTIQDRQFVAQRGPTASYRVYFLPAAFGDVNTQALRQAGHRAASLVTEVSATGRGEALKIMDSQFAGQKGNYYCVAVNRRGIEGSPEQVVKV